MGTVADGDSLVDGSEALAQAATSGEPVEIETQRGEYETVFANPSGSLTMEVSSVPVWAASEAGWVPVDTSLRQTTDGELVPAAVTTPVAFSGGGSDLPLVSMRRDELVLSLSWPDPLPEPVLEGATATYQDVFPGVDLQMTAEPEGFSQLLVVEDQTAAAQPELDRIEMRAEVSSGELAESAGNAVEVTDEFGDVVFAAAQPLMWDSSGAASGAGAGDAEVPGEGDLVSAMPVSTEEQSLEVIPNQKLLESGAAHFPVFIDPQWTPSRTAWTMVHKQYPYQEYFKWSGRDGEGVGHQTTSGASTKRLMFQFPLRKVAGADIQRAEFWVPLLFSHSCTASPLELWRTGGIDQHTNWSN
jgi:hypothetical protein